MNNYYFEILHNFLKTKTISSDFIKKINKDSANLQELFKLFFSMFNEIPESQDLIYFSIALSQDVPPFYAVQALNNLTVLLFQSNMIDLSKRVSKFCLKYYEQDLPQLNIITHLNLARIQYFLQNYIKCLHLTEKALINYEQFIFKEIKTDCNPSDILLLLNGYLLYAKSVQNLQLQGSSLDIDFQQFFVNGAKLGRKYLGQSHPVTRQFLANEKGSTVKKVISNYLSNKKFAGKIINQRKIVLQVELLLRNLKQGKTPSFKHGRSMGRSISEVQGFKLLRRPESGILGQQKLEQLQQPQKNQISSIQKGNFRIQSPKLFPIPQTQTSSKPDIDTIIQRKLDTFMKQQNIQKKQEPKISEMEQKIEDLTKENQRIQNQRIQRELEVEELKEQISQLSAEASKIKLRLLEQENFSEKLKQQQQQQQQDKKIVDQFQQQNKQTQQTQISTQQQQSTDSQQVVTKERMSFGIAASQLTQIKNQSILKKDRQSTIDIHNLINCLVDQDERDSISMINDTDFTMDLNLTILDQIDQSKQYSINLMLDQTIVKQTLIDNVLYELSCGLIQKNKELFIRIIMSTKQESIQPKQEYIELSIIKDLIQYLDYKHILPYTKQMKCLNTFKSFVQYLIIPFVSIKDDEGDQTITIYSQPQSLINENFKLQFCDDSHIPYLYALEDGIFRLQINNIIIDLSFDQSSIEQYFEIYGQDDFEREDISEMMRMAESNEKSSDTVKPKQKVFNIKSYIVMNQQKLVQFLQKLIDDLEDLLRKIFNLQQTNQIFKILNGTQITMPNNSQAKVLMTMIKIWGKCVFQRIHFIADNTREQCFEVLLSNNYDTFGPKQSKVKALGHTQISYDKIQAKFGINVTNLDQSDFQLLSNLICKSYSLLIFTKELDVDDYDRFKENAIQEVEISCECNKRLFLTKNDTYKIPFTIQYLGIEDQPIGLKILLYDINSNTESGMFLTISREIWDKLEIQVKGKHQRKYALQNKLSSQYHLPQLLLNGGFKVIQNKITVDDNKIYRILHGKQISYIDRLENVLNTYSFLNYFLNNKNDS